MQQILDDSGAHLQSCYRANDAAALLAKCGKHSQTWLYQHQGRPEQPNPANPPGRSTHELRSDGVAYPGPAGRKLLYWQVGIDVDDGHVQAFIRSAAKFGYRVTVTYPGSRSEYHHLNFRKMPVLKLPALKRGSKGPRVVNLTRRLKRAGFLKGARWNYDSVTEDAVKAFQKEYHQKVDGKWGSQSNAQLTVVLRKIKKEA
jgi:hypothetical protein